MTDNELALRENTTSMREIALGVTIVDDHDYESAGWIRRDIKSTVKRVQDYWAPLKQAAYDQHRAIVAREAEFLTPLKEADKIVESRMLDYYREQERIRREAEIERRRQEEDRRRQEEAARRAAEEAARLLAEAAQDPDGEIDEDTAAILTIAQAQADEAAAAVVEAEPVYIPSAPKAYGMAVKKVWRARIVDAALVPVEIAGIVIRPVDEKLLNKLAVTSQGRLQCPGVEWYQDEQTAVRL